MIKLHLYYLQAPFDTDTDKLWIILRQSVTQHGSFNVSEIKIEWENYKRSTYDLQGNVIYPIYLLSHLPSIYSVFKTSSTNFDAIPIVLRILSVPRLYLLESTLEDIPTSGTNTMALLILN